MVTASLTLRITDQSVDCTLTASTERVVYKPWGLEGGGPGGNASLKIYRGGELISDNPKPRGFKLESGDLIVLKTAGAGGFGPVEKRDPEKIKKDYREGIINDEWLKAAGIELPV